MPGSRGSRVAALAAAALCLAALTAAPALAADNLPPEITVPGAQSVNEDTNLTLSGAGAISVTDPDADPDEIEISLSASNGVLTLATTSGLSITTGDGTSDPDIVFEGTLAEANAALSGLIYRGNQDYNGSDTIQVGADDLGHNGDPPAETDSDSVAITVNAVNDNPVNSLPATQTTNEDSSLTLSTGTGNLLSISDVDALPADDLRLTLNTTPTGSFPTGTMTLATTAGLTFTSGDGTGDQSMTFEGTLAEINAALDGMTFTPNQDMYGTGYGSGAGNIRVTTNDLGHNPAPAKLDSNDELAIHVNPVDNDPPTNHIVPGIGTYKNIPEELSLASGNQLEVRDLDDNELPTDQLEVSLSVTNGTMTFDNSVGFAALTFSDGDGTGDTTMTFTGDRSDITGAFDNGLTFTPDSGFTGTAQITMETEDLTNTPGPDQDVGDIQVDNPGDTVYYGGSKVTGTTTVPHVQAVLGRAELDGGGGANLVGGPTLADNPAGIAIDLVEEKIYWSVTHPSSGTTPRIYRANLDGSGSPEEFVTGNTSTPTGTAMNSTPSALVIDQTTRRLYWSSTDTTPPFDLASKAISYVSLDGPVPATSGGTVAVSTGTGSGGPRPFALDLANDRLFFGDTTGDAVGVAPIPGETGTNSRFTVTGATPSDPLGIAYNPDTNRLYWGNSTGDPQDERVRYADLNGTTSITGQVFDIGTSTGGGFRGMALDPAANRLYWGLTSGGGKIEHASLAGDGSDSGPVDLGDANHNNLDGVTLLKKPEPVSPPSVSGTPTPGSTLTCAAATWAADFVSGALYRMPRSTAFSWTRDGNAIAGANNSTYTPTETGTYKCVHSATNFAGTSTQESAAVSVVAGSNAVTIPDDAVDKSSKNGTATLTINVPGPGELQISGSGLQAGVAATTTITVTQAGPVVLKIRAKGKKKKRLNETGKVTVKPKITFTPTGGTTSSQTLKVKLKKKTGGR
jgi:hypothetical protein